MWPHVAEIKCQVWTHREEKLLHIGWRTALVHKQNG